MNNLTKKISVYTDNDLFFVEHISDDGKTSSICYSDSIFDENNKKIGLLDQVLLARSWFVCISTADVLYNHESFKEEQKKTLKIIKHLNEALLYLGGEKFDPNINFSGQLNKKIAISIENKNYICMCDIKWWLEPHEQEMPSLLYIPKFSWWLEKEQENDHYTNKPLFKKGIEFNTLYSEDWIKILNGRDFYKFLEDIIKKYD